MKKRKKDKKGLNDEMVSEFSRKKESKKEKSYIPGVWIFLGLLVSAILASLYYYLEGIFWNIGNSENAILFCMVLALGFIWPSRNLRAAWKESKVCGLPLEILLTVGACLFVGGIILLDEAQFWLGHVTVSRNMMTTLGIGDYKAKTICYILEIAAVTVFLFCGWYIGVSARAVYVLGLWQYLKQKCLVIRFLIWVKNICKNAWVSIQNFNLTKNANQTIIHIVLINAAILMLVGIVGVASEEPLVISVLIAGYSVALYFVLRKYISTIQKRYTILLKGVNDIAEGNLNVTITEDLGIFEPMKPQIFRIQDGFKKAVENEVKSQRMKSELITNVSHDLKTPLTAIITYINLLKEENITEEQRKEYLDTLERKSLRLKVLIEDLFEVSKANSNNMTLNYMDVDILNLVKQVSFEMADKLNDANLDMRMNLPDGKINLRLDSQKTYRVYENLFGNVAKYAMPGTRVYVSGALKENYVEIILKNIAAQEITVDSMELTERFVRNDTSRNTEGSGLGLAIAKSFMELQGGELLIEVDGDLFKVTTRWPINRVNLDTKTALADSTNA